MDLQAIVGHLALGEYAEFYAEESSALHLGFEDGKIDEIESGQSCGFSLRYLQGDETRFGYADGLDIALAQRLSLGLSQGLRQTDFDRNLPALQWRKHICQRDPFTVSLDEKVRLMQEVEQAARSVASAELIQQVSLSYGQKIKKVRCVSRQGPKMQVTAEERLYTVFAVTVVAQENGLLQTATEVCGALCGWEIFTQNDPLKIARQAAWRAIEKLRAHAAPVGQMPVILEAQAGGTMIHEAIGHSLEADAVQKGISPVYAGKVGTVVANAKISVYDDPTLQGRRGSFVYDDEGTRAQATQLVENGVLKTYLYDRITAAKEGRFSNGHGRRESYAYRPIPRMSNTFIAPGPDNPAEILRSVKDGLLVRRMGGGQVNPVTGDFVFEVEEGYKIQDGKVGPMVRGASLLGNGPQVLQSIDLVGSDLGWGVGTCGKEGQGVPVSDAQPTLRVPSLLVGGQE